jgi:hypothetical protein
VDRFEARTPRAWASGDENTGLLFDQRERFTPEACGRGLRELDRTPRAWASGDESMDRFEHECAERGATQCGRLL